MAWKCDQHPAHRSLDASQIEQKAKEFLGDVRAFQSSETSPDTQRECITSLTRSIVSAKRRKWIKISLLIISHSHQPSILDCILITTTRNFGD